MFTVITYAAVAAVAFVAGLLVGRKHPAVADAAANGANAAVTAAKDVSTKV